MGNRSTYEGALAALREQDALIAEVERIARIGTYVYDFETGAFTRSLEMKRLWPLPVADDRATLDDILVAVHPDDRAEIAANYGRLQQGEERVRPEPRVRGADGKWRHLHIRSEIVPLEGHPNPVLVGTVQDVTEIREAERTIAAQNERLKEMQAELIYLARQSAMGTMAGTLAHELNQPLTAIASYASGLRRTLESPGALETLAEGLIALQQNALRAGEIIRRMREMVQTGTVRKEPLDLEEVVREAARFSLLGREDIRFSCQMPGAPKALGDRVQIQQVLINLMKNACDAMDNEGGEIVVSATGGDRHVTVRVADTGPGIPETLLPVIFEGKVSTKATGMGIGLSISRTIVEAHGGKIQAETSPEGATFCFTLPAA